MKSQGSRRTQNIWNIGAMVVGEVNCFGRGGGAGGDVCFGKETCDAVMGRSET